MDSEQNYHSRRAQEEAGRARDSYSDAAARSHSALSALHIARARMSGPEEHRWRGHLALVADAHGAVPEYEVA